MPPRALPASFPKCRTVIGPSAGLRLTRHLPGCGGGEVLEGELVGLSDESDPQGSHHVRDLDLVVVLVLTVRRPPGDDDGEDSGLDETDDAADARVGDDHVRATSL